MTLTYDELGMISLGLVVFLILIFVATLGYMESASHLPGGF